MFIDSVSCVVVLFQIIRILITDEISISIIQIRSLIIGFITSLVVIYKSVFIICRIQFLVEVSVVIINQNIIIHILTVLILVYGTLLVALFASIRVP